MMIEKAGKIVTFYSYKGGTGRTMALSNVAWILASNGFHVLLIDWDLEAPGLHRYLRPFLIDSELATTPGLIDYVWDAAQVSMTPPVQAEGDAAAPAFPSLEQYIIELDWDFGGRGSISFIPAGQQDENYAQRVNTFNWDNFYERLGGGKLLQAERELLKARFDYILIDSRTGVSDTSSVCTVQMPDAMVAFFTLNWQSIKGTVAVASSVISAVQAVRNESLPVFPVPTRIENAETAKLDAAIAYARRMFAPFLLHVQSHADEIDLSEQALYWKQVETPYQAYYAFEEVPAAFKDDPGGHDTVLAANEGIVHWITGGAAVSLQPESEERRQEVVGAYAFTAEEKIGWASSPALGASPSRSGLRQLKARRWPWKKMGVLLLFALLSAGWMSSLVALQTANQNLATAKADLNREKQLSRDKIADIKRSLENISARMQSVIARMPPAQYTPGKRGLRRTANPTASLMGVQNTLDTAIKNLN